MSYDIALFVIAQGCDQYVCIGRPEKDSPTYNLGKLFRECMDWDFSQSEFVEGEYRPVYYPCKMVVEKLDHGIEEILKNPAKYKRYEPDNGWGTMSGALDCMQSLKNFINEKAEYIPIECMYMAW